MRELGQDLFNRGQLDFFQGFANTSQSLFLVRYAIDDHRLFQDSLHVHERWQRPVWILLNVADLGSVLSQLAALDIGQPCIIENDVTAGRGVQTENGLHEA